MLCERVLGNLFEPVGAPAAALGAAAGVEAHEHITLRWDECGKRLQRKRSSRGREIGLALAPGSRLRHGDILHRDEAGLLVVRVLPTQVLVVRPATMREMGRCAWALGNRHLPLAVEEGELILLADSPTATLLDRLGLPYQEEDRRFQPLAPGGEEHPVHAVL